MILRCKIEPHSEKLALEAIEWLHSIGATYVDSIEELIKLRPVEVQLKVVPEVLAFFGKLVDAISISSINERGIAFYLTNIPLLAGIPEERQRVTSEASDGDIFCPMNNVVAVNFFGSVSRKKQAS
ncbi:hypothetical protein [Crenobacter cavernae]|uniref:hypothetical protein n=1 Tax=Crenobacter cavernae TaxID=2290923 RepID=UPI0011C017DD|nr:hypothetical protein [Crenobacter cavernae]